jgi:uncharacterized DUF497 family protein
MEFEWDERKNASNLEKHGVTFQKAARVFEHPTVTVVDNRFAYDEVRLITIGMVAEGEILTVVHTERAGHIRLISARPASRGERRRYEQETS